MGGFYGGSSPAGGLASVDVAVCTIEKANNLINRLLEEDGLNQLGELIEAIEMIDLTGRLIRLKSGEDDDDIVIIINTLLEMHNSCVSNVLCF